MFSILRINALLNPQLHIDAYPLAIAQEDSELMFQYGWRAAAQKEFHCNGGVTGVTGSDVKELFVKKKAGDFPSFLSSLDFPMLVLSNSDSLFLYSFSTPSTTIPLFSTVIATISQFVQFFGTNLWETYHTADQIH